MQLALHKNRAMRTCVIVFLQVIVSSECVASPHEANRARTIARHLNATGGFGWGLLGVDRSVIRAVFDSTLNECILECAARPRCKAFEYKTRQKYCKLVSSYTSRERRAGYVSLTGFDTLANGQCAQDTCDEPETCLMSSASEQPECRIQDCGYPTDVQGYVFGNRYHVGSRLFNHHDNGIRPITCGENGMWEYGHVQPYPGVTCGDIRKYRNDVTSGVFRNKFDIKIYFISRRQFIYSYSLDPNQYLFCDAWPQPDWSLVFQRRHNGSEDFHRNWIDYRNGFGDLNGEFWLGLDPLYRILESPGGSFKLQIDLENVHGIKASVTYSHFSIANEEDKYRLYISGFNGTGSVLDDAMYPSNALQFTTKDRDNDNNVDGNCADIYSGGWWFRSCVVANLNGMYRPTDPHIAMTGIVWHQWTQGASLKASTMKIQRNG